MFMIIVRPNSFKTIVLITPNNAHGTLSIIIQIIKIIKTIQIAGIGIIQGGSDPGFYTRWGP